MTDSTLQTNQPQSVIVYQSRSEQVLDDMLWNQGFGADFFVLGVGAVVALGVGAVVALVATAIYSSILEKLAIKKRANGKRLKPNSLLSFQNRGTVALTLGIITGALAVFKMWI